MVFGKFLAFPRFLRGYESLRTGSLFVRIYAGTRESRSIFVTMGSATLNTLEGDVLSEQKLCWNLRRTVDFSFQKTIRVNAG